MAGMTSEGREQLGGDEAAYWRWRAEYWRAEAEFRAAAEAELKTQNVALRARVGELEAQVVVLTEKVVTLARLAFGTSSEKAAARGAPGPEGDDDAAEGAPCGEGSGRRGRGQQGGSVGHGRRDYSHLPTREEVHDVGEGERVCPRCGAGYVPFGQESCEQIDWQVQLTRVVHRRPTYRRTCGCPVRGVLVAPPVPKAIGKGRFSTGFLARLLVEKFVLGRPVHRIVAALAHDGLELPEGTLAGVSRRARSCWAHWLMRSVRATPPRRTCTLMKRVGRCSPRCRARTVTAGGAGCSSARTPRCSRSPRHGR